MLQEHFLFPRDLAFVVVTPYFPCSIHPDVREATLCYAIQSSSELFAEALQKWKTEQDLAKQVVWGEAMSCTADHSLLKR